MNNTILTLGDGLVGKPQSYWLASTPETNYPALENDLEIDVAIIGGGLVGITSAYLLKKEGLKVAVIDADRIIHGTTAHTTAKITSQHGLIHDRIKKQMGKEKAQQYADANESAIRFIADLVKEKNIDCDFSPKYACIYTQSEQYIQQIQDEAKAALELGIKATYLEEIELPIKVKAALRYDNQAQFHPGKYLLAIAGDISGDECYIFENTRVMDIKEDKNVTVITENGKHITAKYVIIASHYPCFDGGGMYFARMYATRSYVIAAKVKENFPNGMFITAEDPGRSLRSQPYEDGEMIIFGGEHHKTGQGEDTTNHFNNIRKFAIETYAVEKFLYRWSTQDYETIDMVPYVGKLTSGHKHIYVATGFRKWGMSNGTASAIILRDLIVKGKSAWEDVYTPSRFIPSSVGELIKDNVDVAKHLIKGKLQNVPENAEIKNGEAKKLEVNGKKAGAYRDDQGILHILDVTCTHLGCELSWNSAEKSWDCPCHGSRFTYDGRIIEGPAIHSLKHIGERTNEKDPNIFQ